MLCCWKCRAVLTLDQFVHHKCVKYTPRLGNMLWKTTRRRVNNRVTRGIK